MAQTVDPNVLRRLIFDWYCEEMARFFPDFKVSDTPPSGPEGISGHAHKAPHNNKEIA